MSRYGISKDGRPIMDKYPFQGLSIIIEYKADSVKPGTDKHGMPASYVMKYDYGYVENSLGTDKEPVDVYVGPHCDSKFVFIVDQMKKPEFVEFDEQKVMLGFKTEYQAAEAYLNQYEDPRFLGCIRAFTMDQFKARLMEYYGEIIKSLIDNNSNATLKLSNTMTSSKDDLSAVLDSIRNRNELLSSKAPCASNQSSLGTDRRSTLVEPRVVPTRRINYFPSPVSLKRDK